MTPSTDVGSYKANSNGSEVYREIRFDQPLSAIKKLKTGEFIIDSIPDVEDTKVVNDITSGLSSITGVTAKSVISRCKGGSCQALYVLTKFTHTRFEFIFTQLMGTGPRLLTSVQAVHRAFETTKLYRDLKLRAAIIHEKDLIMLAKETLYDRVSNVWSLSSEQGNVGTLFITNVRVVWFSELSENFNVSVPYMQMKQLSIKSSKFGKALVIETSLSSGGYLLGFSVESQDKLEYLRQQIANLQKVFSQKPIYGVEYRTEGEKALEGAVIHKVDDDVQILQNPDGESAYLYCPLGSNAEDRAPMYNGSLGLAVESTGRQTSSDVVSLWRRIS